MSTPSRARAPLPRALLAALLPAALLPAAALPAAAGAQGFGLNEIGSCAIGRGAAVTSDPCADASSLYWNPGAVATVPRGTSLYVGGSAIQVRGGFTEDGTGRFYRGNVPVEFPPFLGLTVRRTPRLALGLAAYVPYGLTSQWNDDFPGRFAAQRASLQTFYVQPTAAYEVVPGRLSVGAGAIFGYSTLELRQSLDLATTPAPAALQAAFGLPDRSTLQAAGIQPLTEFGRARVRGSATGGGFHLGLHARVTPTVAVGARYLSQVNFRYSGATAEFTVSPQAAGVTFPAGNPFALPPAGATQSPPVPLAALVAAQFADGGPLGGGQTASTRIDHPAQIQAGVAFTGLPNTRLTAEWAQIRWSSFQELPVDFRLANGTPNVLLSRTLREGYRNSNSARAGLEYRVGRVPTVLGRLGVTSDSARRLALRLGFSYAQTPAPAQTVTPLLPDMDRFNFHGGVGLPLGRRAVLDLAYLRVETRGRRGRTFELPAAPSGPTLLPGFTTPISNGFYALNANVFSASVRAALFR